MGHRLAKSRLPCDFLSECGKVEWETEPSAVMSLSLFVLRRHTHTSAFKIWLQTFSLFWLVRSLLIQ